MNFDFPYWLIIITAITGIIWLCDWLYMLLFNKKNYDSKNVSTPILVDYSRSLFPILLIVICVRTLVFEPFRVPTGSLEPTILPGDFIIANKFTYGTKIPLTNITLNAKKPERGDIVVFHTPVDNKTWLVKRVIGLPGDHISYINKKLIINDKEIIYKFINNSRDTNDGIIHWNVNVYEEELSNNHTHKIYINPNLPSLEFKDLVVPTNQYFVMGDNRDNSDDSRYWGFLPINNIAGKVSTIFFSTDEYNFWHIRWHRIGTMIK